VQVVKKNLTHDFNSLILAFSRREKGWLQIIYVFLGVLGALAAKK